MSLRGRPPHKDRVYRARSKSKAESAPRKKNEQPKKTSIGVLIDADVWKQFRMHCLVYDESPGNLLSDIIQTYLVKQGSYQD